MEIVNFIKRNGKSMLDIGINDYVLNFDDSISALNLFNEESINILGGDIYLEIENELVLAYKIWGSKYHFINWYCQKNRFESNEEYQKRSVILAKENILNVNEIAKSFNHECYINFVF